MKPVIQRIVLILVLAVAIFANRGAFAAGRIALVIGNGGYQAIPRLPNPRNDADDVSAQLKRVGFDVLDGRDLTRVAMYVLIRKFALQAQGSEAALVFYAGHGLQVNGRNYLLPVDAKLESGRVSDLDLIRLDDVIDALERTGGVRLLILDACRDNPIAAAMPADAGSARGLAKIERTQGMLIAYSTQPNAVAADGEGRNSPFSAALARELAVPGIEIGAMFRRVAINVNRETNGMQTPELSVSLLQDFYMNPQESDIDAWNKLGAAATRPDLEAFIARFPDSSLKAAAQSRVDAVDSAARQEQLVREFEEKERRLRARLEEFEAGYRKATEELASLRNKPGDTGSSYATAASAPAPAAPSAVPPAAAAAVAGGNAVATGQQQADAEKAERLTTIIATLDADKAKIAAERAELEKAMRENLARAQATREQAERRVAAEVARLPLAVTAPAVAPAPRPRAVSCRELNARAQLGDLSDSDRAMLRSQCR